MGTAVQLSGRPRTGFTVFALVVVGRVYRALLLTLVAVALLPVLWQWSSHVVRSGSMRPSIGVGDVVIAMPFGHDEKVPVGRVMIFDPPPGSGGDGAQRIHRVTAKLYDGRYETTGDANHAPDVEPIRRDDFRARPLILVRYVGLPVHWLAEGDYLPLGGWLLLSAVLFHFSFRRLDDEQPRRPGKGGRLVATAGAAALLLTVPESASAAFTDHATNGSNTFKAAAILQQRYTAAVAADSPWGFYRLDESSGANAADSGGNNRTGTYTAVAAYRETGALPNNTGYSTRYAANLGRMVAGGTALSDPTTFSVELWFKTTSTAGGKLVGFENTRNQISPFYDREVVLRTDGRLTYVGGASTSKVVVSPTALNDGKWHHLVVTSVPAGGSNLTASMYVDGALAATGTTIKASSVYTGWWRIGYGQIPAGTAFPVTGNLTGSVDDVAIYTTSLSATRVAAHYAAR